MAVKKLTNNKKKKPLQKKPSKKTGVSSARSGPSRHDDAINSVEHYNAVLIEDLKSDFRFVLEKVVGLEDLFKTELTLFKKDVNDRFTTVESVLAHHSDLLMKNDQRWEQNEKRWEQNNKEHLRIESKLDNIAHKVERHDQDIQEIKSVVFAS